MNELALPAALDQAGIGKDFEVMRNGGRGNAGCGDQVATDYFFFGGDGLINSEARGIRQSL